MYSISIYVVPLSLEIVELYCDGGFHCENNCCIRIKELAWPRLRRGGGGGGEEQSNLHIYLQFIEPWYLLTVIQG